MSRKAKTKIENYLGVGAVVLLLIITMLLGERQRSLITINEAKTAAETQFVEARAVEVNLKTKHGIQVYDIFLDNGMKVRVDAHSGTIVKIDVIKGDLSNEK